MPPVSVQVPVPVLVTEVTPDPMILAILPVVEPSKVNPKAPDIVPVLERAIFPALATILLVLPNVTKPL